MLPTDCSESLTKFLKSINSKAQNMQPDIIV